MGFVYLLLTRATVKSMVLYTAGCPQGLYENVSVDRLRNKKHGNICIIHTKHKSFKQGTISII